MTQKDIIRMASNPDIQWMMQEIAQIQSNMCHKSIYERKSATRRMKNYAREIQEILLSDDGEEE